MQTMPADAKTRLAIALGIILDIDTQALNQLDAERVDRASILLTLVEAQGSDPELIEHAARIGLK